MMAVGDGRRRGRQVLAAILVGGVMVLAGCADGADSVDGEASSLPLASDAAGVATDTGSAEEAAATDGAGDGQATLVVSSDGSADGQTLDDGGEGDGASSGSGAAALDAEPQQSDPTGDVPAGPPAPAPADDQNGTEDDADDSAGTSPADDQGGTGQPDADRPEPTVDTDTSPDDGDVPNGVSGDTDVRENLSYPSASVIALDNGSTTTLAATLAGSDQPTLLWFWTPDCPTCVPESAAVADFARTHAGSIRVLGVGVGGSRADADAFVAAAELDGSVLVWSQGPATHSHYNVTATPFAIMVAPNGVVMAQWRGMVPELFAFADRL